MAAARFVWVELMTGDLPAATVFYTRVVGWGARDAGTPGMDYTLLTTGDAPVAGMMETPAALKAMGAPSAWSGYIAVDDVDAMSARLLQAGGKVLRPADDIPGIGRFAVVADPQGASFVLFKPMPSEAPPAPPAPGAIGTTSWRELRAMDGPAVFDFYAALFGWTRGEAHSIGDMGIYQVFEIDGVPAGGIVTKQADAPSPGWRYYFSVDAIDAAAQRVTAHGGTIEMEPILAGGGWILHARDPQGAVFSLASMTK